MGTGAGMGRLDTVLGRDAALRRPAPRAAAQQAESDIIPRMFRPLCTGRGQPVPAIQNHFT